MGVPKGGVFVLGLLIGVATVVHGHGSHKSHGHAHTHPGAAEGKHDSALQNTNIIRDAAHIKEHLSDQVNQRHIDQMSPEELQFQFFASHDLNGDGRLDGLEIFKSLEHAVEHLEIMEGMEEDKIMVLTDDVLGGQDINKDGYLDYMEYTLGHKNAREQQRTPPPEHSHGHPQGQGHDHQSQAHLQGHGKGQVQAQGQVQNQGQIQGQASVTPHSHVNQGL